MFEGFFNTKKPAQVVRPILNIMIILAVNVIILTFANLDLQLTDLPLSRLLDRFTLFLLLYKSLCNTF
jgi:hypothetical protein